MLDSIFLSKVPLGFSVSDITERLREKFEVEGGVRLLGVHLDEEERVAVLVVDVPPGRVAVTQVSRSNLYKEGRVPLHALRADIDYATYEAHTTYGVIGIR